MSHPGVGEYDISQDILKAQHFNIPMRYNASTLVQRTTPPGPTDYALQQSGNMARHGAINRKSRFTEEKKALEYEVGTPGPGHYKPEEPKVKVPHSSTFGRHNKVREIASGHNPIGPGSYEVNTNFNKMPAYLLKGNKLNEQVKP